MPLLMAVHRKLEQIKLSQLCLLSLGGIAIAVTIDYFTGDELSVALFYQLPIVLAAWYGGRRLGLTIASLAAVSVLLTDLLSGRQFSHPAILVWNTFASTVIFMVTSILSVTLRTHKAAQEQLARRDSLTNLYNRRAFIERLEHDISLALRRKTSLSLAYVDLDNFKQINDRYGHGEGDKVLRLIGKVLITAMRREDTVARLGGDEFAVILPDTNDAAAQIIITKLKDTLLKELAAHDSQTTCSIGVITMTNEALDADKMIAAADNLMYQIKYAGKNAIAYGAIGAAQPAA